jgi:uncharacterized membrane protein YhdT
MRFLGTLLFLYGVAATVFAFLKQDSKGVFDWTNNWGVEAGWAIRIGFIVLGALFLLAGRSKGKKRD